MKILLLFLAGILFQEAVYGQREVIKDFKKHFEKHGVDGCFVLYSQADKRFIRYNAAYCDSAYLPASTFKIPNAVIALEEGIVKDTAQVFKWNGQQWNVPTWNQDQTLRTAIKYSCVWVFVDIARRVGIDRYRQYIDLFHYGNEDLSGPPDHFWLEGPFAISANQQVSFLRKFYNHKLGVSEKSVDIVKDLLILEKGSGYVWSGKTGAGNLPSGEDIMWLVGYLEKEGKPYFYAMNFKTGDVNKTKQARYDIVRDILKELKLLE